MRFFPRLSCVLASAALCLNVTAMSAEWLTYFGTYSGDKSKGIYLSRFDPATGRLSEPELAAEAKNPTYLALHPSKPFLYAVSEVSTWDGKPTGAVSSFRIESSGRLQIINQQPSQGKGPCHVSVDATGKSLLVANYGSGSIAALPVRDDGSLGAAASAIQHEGSSVNPKRQTGPHAHQAVPSPDNRFALFCDLGIDKVMVYQLNAAGALLEPADPPSAALKPGAGPRHLVFRPDGKFLYVINELDSTISTFAYEARAGRLDPVQSLSTLPADFKGESWCAAVKIHPNSRFVYGSNRGHDSIVVFAADKNNGKLELVQHMSSGGKFPRDFAIDPTGKWLISMNQNSGDIVVYPLDPETGKLGEAKSRLSLPSPVCAVFVEPSRSR